MGITEQQKANALFKKFQGRADTSPYLEFYEEPLKSSFIVTPENFWIDTQYIPDTAPLLQDREEFTITFDNGFQLPVLRKYNNLYLDQIPGATASFYHEELADALPHDYKDGSFHYTLTDAADQELAYGLNAWVVDHQAGVLTFYQGLPADVVLPLKISFYRYIGRKTFEGVVQTDGTTPMVDEYVPVRDQDVTTKKYVDNEVAYVQDIVDRLIPEPPPGLSERTLVMQLYKAYAVGSGEEHDCTPFARPEIHVDGPFHDGSAGTLAAKFNNTVVTTLELTPESAVGSHGAIHITADEDPYAGENQRQNFHKQLRGYIQPTSDLLPRKHTAQLEHSITGETPIKEFWVDSLASNAQVSLTSASSIFSSNTTAIDPNTVNISSVSGVPTLTTQSALPLGIRVVGVAGTHYAKTVAQITSSHIKHEAFDVTSPVASPSQQLTFTRNLQIRPNVYTENLEFHVVALNSAQEPIGTLVISRPFRVDTVSNETRRVRSGSGMYPALGDFGQPFLSNQHLGESEELQMIGGVFQWPSGDYTSSIPAGPNYNDIPKTGIRWATLKSVDLTYADGFTLQINGAQNWTANSETQKTAHVYIFAHIENDIAPQGNRTEWIDCNTPYAGVGRPEKNGDGAMIISHSSATIKRVTFGTTTRSGRLFLRIGLPAEDKRFSTITITPN